MGWCQEFGPQISEGCDHAMVAGSSACSCPHCGAVCKGKFGGCVNVWARGPDQTLVRTAPARTSVPANATTSATTEAAATDSGGGSDPADSDSGEAVGLDHVLQRVTRLEDMAERLETLERSRGGINARVLARLQQLSNRASAVDDVSERVRALEQANGRVRNMEKALNHVVEDLGHVMRSGSLDEVTKRVARLEHRLPGEQPPSDDVMQEMKRLAAEVDRLGAVPRRVAALEQTQGDSPDEELRDVREGLTSLSAEVAQLRSAPDRSRMLEELSSRLSKLEQAVPQAVPQTGAQQGTTLAAVQSRLERLTTHVAALQSVPERVRALEQAQGHGGDPEPALAALRRDVEKLSAYVAPLPQLREQVGTLAQSQDRLRGLEAALDGVERGLAEVRAQRSPVDDIANRLKTLEDGRARTDELLDNIGKRFDRLGTRVGALKNVPDRMELLEKTVAEADTAASGFDRLQGNVVALADTMEELTERLHRLEQASSRSDAVARGLSGAIEALDQLSAQVAGLEHTVNTWGERGDDQRRAR